MKFKSKVVTHINVRCNISATCLKKLNKTDTVCSVVEHLLCMPEAPDSIPVLPKTASR